MKKELKLNHCVLPEICLVPGDEVSIMVSVLRDGVRFVYRTPDLTNHDYSSIELTTSCF